MWWQVLIIPVLSQLSPAVGFEVPRQGSEHFGWKCCGGDLGATVYVWLREEFGHHRFLTDLSLTREEKLAYYGTLITD